MKFLLIFIIFYTINFASSIQEEIWWKGETLLTFLEKYKIPKSIYFNLPKTDKELCSDIYAGVQYQLLLDNNKLEQVLIPISEQMQIHIFKIKNKYKLNIIPIHYHEATHTIAIPIKYSPYQDIISYTNNKKLANEFTRSFRKIIDFTKIRKGNILTIKYIQKIRLGRYFGVPNIIAFKIEINHRKKYIFQNPKDKRYYDLKGRSLTSFFLKIPLRYTRISSKFTKKRWHPILKRYMAHHGIDYAAPTGRKIFASANGKIIFKGRKGGYGNAIIIRHKGGYKTLYAHMYKFARVRKGQWVKQGKHIGYVGSTGRSTGPHLHFGLYKNGSPINPARVLSITKIKLRGKKRKLFLRYAKKTKKELDNAIKEKQFYQKIIDFKISYKIKSEG